MPISEEELKEIIKSPNADIEKISTISSDGKNLLTRIPKEIVEYLKIKKGNKLFWLLPIGSEDLILKIYYVDEKKK